MNLFLNLCQTGDNGVLYIDEITREDSGQFKCVAANANGETDVWVTNITVMGEYRHLLEMKTCLNLESNQMPHYFLLTWLMMV